MDSCDIWIPANNLGYTHLNDGVIGLLGSVLYFGEPVVCLRGRTHTDNPGLFYIERQRPTCLCRHNGASTPLWLLGR